MQVGWRDYFKRRLRKPSAYHSIGIEYGVNQLQIATVQRLNGELTWVKQHKILGADWSAQLPAYTERQKTAKIPCYASQLLSIYLLRQWIFLNQS